MFSKYGRAVRDGIDFLLLLCNDRVMAFGAGVAVVSFATAELHPATWVRSTLTLVNFFWLIFLLGSIAKNHLFLAEVGGMFDRTMVTLQNARESSASVRLGVEKLSARLSELLEPDAAIEANEIQRQLKELDSQLEQLLNSPTLIQLIDSRIQKAVKPRFSRGAVSYKRGPTERTKIRGEVFRKLKEKHPTWSQNRVAIEASKELDEQVTADTVRNTYRQLGWKWERADRIR